MAHPVTIYHNARCSKSRQACALLKDRAIEPRVIEYLKTPPTAQELAGLLDLLGLPPRALIRTQDARKLGLDLENRSDEALIGLMVQHPILIERPIVVAGGRAVLGRPPERVLGLLT
jgi:arsenate reductase